jgi:hypothetical protein
VSCKSIQSTHHKEAMLSLNISSYPVYEHILKLGRERPDAVLLDLGCCCTSNHDMLCWSSLTPFQSVLMPERRRQMVFLRKISLLRISTMVIHFVCESFLLMCARIQNFSSLATNFSKRHQLLTLDASFPEMFLIQNFFP